MKSLKFLLILFLVISKHVIASPCVGRFVNPITDICWSCIFPLTIGPFKLGKHGELQDTPNPSQSVCVCPHNGIPVPGLAVGFWEPVRLIDVTRTPFCMVNLGGISLSKNLRHHGDVSQQNQSFYHVHYYIYPLIYWLELLVNFACLESSGFDLAYITELDPLWGNDELALIINPEVAIFSNPIAQLACTADCAASTIGLGLDHLFWCAGCQGSMYPFTGNAEHIGGVQASMLLAQRMLAKLHRQGLLWGSMGTEALCARYPMPLMRKSQYRLQMTYPVPATNKALGCHPAGRSETLLAAGREFPFKGEDFGYLVWRKRTCCLL